MVKTANPTDDKPTPPPSDAQIVKAFIAEAGELKERAKIAKDDKAYETLIAHVGARLELAKALEDGKTARAEYIKDAGDRIVKAATDAGKAVADLVNKLHAKAEERADQDRK